MSNLNPRILIGIFYFFYFALIGIYIIFLPQMLKKSGFSGLEVGEIFSIAPMMRFILPFIFRKFGGLNLTVYKISLFLIFLTSIFFYFSVESFWKLLIVNIFYGSAMGIIIPFIDTIALKLISKERYGKVRLWGSIGFIVVAILLGKILENLEETIFYLIILAFATAFSGYLILKFSHYTAEKKETLKEKLSLSKYSIWWLSVILFQVSFGGFYNFFTIYETSFGLSLEVTTYLWSFGVISEIVMFYFQGFLLKRFSLLNLIEISILSGFVRWLIIWLYPNNLPMAFLSQFLHAFSFALYYTASISYVYTLYSQKELAQQFFLGISFGLGGSLGAFIAGLVWEYEPKFLFLSQALISLLSYISIFIHHKMVKRRLL